jgi:hypothetical protein
MSVSKEKVRQRCVDLIRDITRLERNGEYGHLVWHRAQEALGQAVAAYRDLGATDADVARLGLRGTKKSIWPLTPVR